LKIRDVSNNYYMPGTLNGEKTYYWKVVVKDSTGAEASSPVWKFSTEKEGVRRDSNIKNKASEGFPILENVLATDTIMKLFNYLSTNVHN